MNYRYTLYQKTTKISREALSTQDIPYRKGKVGARKADPRIYIIKAPDLYDIQENHIRLGTSQDISIIPF